MHQVGSARFRCLTVGLLLTGTCTGAALILLPVANRGISADASFADALTRLSAMVALPALVALLVTGLHGVRDSWRGLPRPEGPGVRRLVMVVCGAGLITATLVPGAYAEPRSEQSPQPTPRSTLSKTLSGLPLPDRALSSPVRASSAPVSKPAIPTLAPAPPAPAPAPAPPEPAVVQVQPGDSLWRISASELSPHASAAQIADHVRRLHALNRAQIGPDPDLIHPGLQLRLPRT